MAENNECTHGYMPHERRHCVHCMYSDELADRDAEIKALQVRVEQTETNVQELESVLYDILDDEDCSLSTREIIEERVGLRG